MIGLLDVSAEKLRDLPVILPTNWRVIGSARCERYGDVRLIVSNNVSDQIPAGHAVIPLLTLTARDARDVRTFTLEIA